MSEALSSRPNIVLILADDMGYGDCGCNSPESKIPTPALDRLAGRGMRFTDAHASSSVCTPSRYSILTGRYSWRTRLKSGVLWPWDPPLIEPDRRTAAGLLRQHGYRTACFGKWHLGWEWATLDGAPAWEGTEYGKHDSPLRHALGRNIDYSKPVRGGPVDCGFDTYFGVDVPNFPPYTWFEDDRLTDPPTEEKPDDLFGHPGLMKPGWKHEAMIPEFTRRAVEYIESSGPEPFFIYFPLTSPHNPIAPNEEFIGRSGAGLYGDFVCEVDWVVGEVAAALERKGIAGDTLLVFTSDNGPECSRSADGGAYERVRTSGHYSMGGLRGVKRDTWEGGHRVPLVASWPRLVPEGARCDQLVMLGDFMATCADFLGVTLAEGEAEDSVSVLPLLRGETGTTVRDSVVHHSCSGQFAVRRGNWVFIDAPSGDDNDEPEWFKAERGYVPHDHPGELFDLGADLSERENLYAERPDVVGELSQLLDATRGERGAGGAPADPGRGSE